jgi:hypothetical protein
MGRTTVSHWEEGFGQLERYSGCQSKEERKQPEDVSGCAETHPLSVAYEVS